MALKYWIPGGNGNWNNATNWSTTSGGVSGATFPNGFDDVIYDLNSGSGMSVLNTLTNCKSFNCSAFTGTLNVQTTLNVSGDTTLGSGVTITASTGNPTLFISNASFLTSNGKRWPFTLTYGSVGNKTHTDTWVIGGTWSHAGVTTITLNGDIVVEGPIIHNATATVNGGTIYCKGNYTPSGGSNLLGTSTFVFSSETTQTWVGGTSGHHRLNTIINTPGTLHIMNTVRFGSATLTYSSGTIITTASTSQIACAPTNTTLDLRGLEFPNISIGQAGIIVSLASDVTITNGFASTVPTLAARSLVRSDITGVPRKLTLLHSASQDVDFCSFWDIDCGDAQTIWVYSPLTITGCTNVNTLLPGFIKTTQS